MRTFIKQEKNEELHFYSSFGQKGEISTNYNVLTNCNCECRPAILTKVTIV